MALSEDDAAMRGNHDGKHSESRGRGGGRGDSGSGNGGGGGGGRGGGGGNVPPSSPAVSAVSSTSLSAGTDNQREKAPLKPQVVRIGVLGDEKVGKTSLICSLVSRHFSERVPGVLLNVQIPAEENNENVIISITDTSSRVSDLVRVANATKRSDAILLVYDLTRPETVQRLRRWLDLIARHKPVPVVLVGNKDDIKTVVATGSMDGLHSHQIRQLTTTYQFAVDGGDCSARNFAQVARAFYYAQKAVLYPVEPLYNGKKRQLEDKCVKAIKRTFRLYDSDRDGILSRDELNDYQHDCFGMRLLAGEMDTMMEFLQATIPEGVKEDGSGVRFEGFVYLWQLFIDRKRPESCWQALRSLGYNNELALEIPTERVTLAPYEQDQSAQLTPQAITFLEALLRQFDADKDGNLTEEEVDEVFAICEEVEPAWLNCSAVSSRVLHATALVADRRVLPRAAWFALWSYLAQENPEKLLEAFYCLGFDDKASQALELTKSRSTTRQASRVERNTVTCYVFASSSVLKTRLAHLLVGRPYVQDADHANEEEDAIVRAVHGVTDNDETKYLLLTEELLKGDVDKHADVVCLLVDPVDAESVRYVEEIERSLPTSVPRVVIGLKPEAMATTAAEWQAVRQQAGVPTTAATSTKRASGSTTTENTVTPPPSSVSDKANAPTSSSSSTTVASSPTDSTASLTAITDSALTLAMSSAILTSARVVDDEESAARAFQHLVRTALRPPNARPRSSRLSTFGVTTTAFLALVVGGVGLMALNKKSWSVDAFQWKGASIKEYFPSFQ